MSLPSDHSRRERLKAMAKDVWFLERDLVSEGYDKALVRLSREIPLTVHEYPSGTEAWTWIIPPKWTCHEAYVERLNGERVIDRKNHPLHCASYSSSFEGIVSRDELFSHLATHPVLKDAIPFNWKYYKTDWGFCCSQDQKEKLTDDQYRVVVRSEHRPGALKVGEYFIRGKTDREFVFCTHLCHPCMMNDDLSGVLVAIEVMRRLKSLPTPYFSYRLLLTPETIGSIAWLSRNEAAIPRIIGGLFLEMLGTDCPHAFQTSFRGDTELDRTLFEALQEVDPDCWKGPYRTVIGNDERQFNAPGVRVPMLSLSRVFHPSTGKWPYPEYHSNKDTPESISWERLEQSVDAVLHLVQRLEDNLYPVNLFRGEVFCSRYGLFEDFYSDPKVNLRLFDVIQMTDGTRTVRQIAEACQTSVTKVLTTLKKLEKNNLIRFQHEPIA